MHIRFDKNAQGLALRSMLAAGIALLSISAAAHARDKAWREVKDPHFGEVLFYFYQQKYFSAITHLMSAQAVHRLKHHEDEAVLLLGGMYLSYGLHREAGRIFQRLIDEGAAAHVRDRAWFYLAKIWYQRGYLAEAEDALARIQGSLSAELQEEHQVLAALVLMKRQRYQEAVRVLGKFEGRSEWAIYARYNMAVALIEVDQKHEGVALLEAIGRLRAKNSEMKALRDKANLALGYAFLRVQGLERAKSYLEKVRLKGPFSTKALLGIGWALSARGKHEQALVPWMELQNRNPIDVAVQESLLAVPYALGKLHAHQQSLQYYESAITTYNAEITRLGHTVDSIRSGKPVLSALLQDPGSEAGWFWRVKNLVDTPENRYLAHLLASHAFHEALKNYRDLVFLSRNLSRWSANMDAYDAMLETRRRGYEERLPQIMQSYRSLDLTALTQARNRYGQELERIESHGDAIALATGTEQSLLARLQRIKATIENLAGSQDVSDYQRKYKLFSGLLLWQISTDYKPRLWQAKKAVRQLDAAIAEARLREQSLQRTQKLARRGFEGYGDRIAALRRRISQLQVEVDRVARTHERYLQELAAAELERQRKRLRTYVTQARFSIAQIYDRAMSRLEVAQWPTKEETSELKVLAQPPSSLPAVTQVAKSMVPAGGRRAPAGVKEKQPPARQATAKRESPREVVEQETTSVAEQEKKSKVSVQPALALAEMKQSPSSKPARSATPLQAQQQEKQSAAGSQEITPASPLEIAKKEPLIREGPSQTNEVVARVAPSLESSSALEEEQQIASPDSSKTPRDTNLASISVGVKPEKAMSDGITKSELRKMLREFVADYEAGNLNRFMSLFAKGARTNERTNRDEIRKDYEELFKSTDMREMALRDVSWDLKENRALGWGNFEVKVQRTGDHQVRTYTGSLTFQIERQGRDIRIKRLYHSQERVEARGQ